MDDDVEIINEGDEETAKDKLKKLKDELKACKSERDDYLAGWQRAKADFINARRDEEKTRVEFVKFAGEQVLREMLAVADSLELAGEDARPVYAQLREILKKEGVETIKAKDTKFDPAFYEALEKTEVTEKEKDGIVLEELQKGYKIHERVLRPAKVKVGHYKERE